MSFFQRLKSKKTKALSSEQKTSNVNEAIHALRSQIAMLNKRKNHLDKKIARSTSEAQACVGRKDKKGALFKLKLRKQNEKRVEGIDNQVFNLEMQILTLDEALMNMNMMNAMKVSAAALKQDNPDELMEEAEQTMADIEEGMDMQNELRDILNRPLVQYDEDELEDELRELESEMMIDMQQQPDNAHLPVARRRQVNNVAPQHEEAEEEDHGQQEEEEEEDDEAAFRKLDMELNMTARSEMRMINVQVVRSAAPRRLIMASC